jgi:hypothetical protein
VCRRLRPFSLRAGSLSVEVKTQTGERRRGEHYDPGISDEEVVGRLAQALSAPLLSSPDKVRGLVVRLGRLQPPSTQTRLFPKVDARQLL